MINQYFGSVEPIRVTDLHELMDPERARVDQSDKGVFIKGTNGLVSSFEMGFINGEVDSRESSHFCELFPEIDAFWWKD